ncbi:hypothetical protein ABZ027_30845 [Streptomyces sp. NPDC006332]|uniref:hypothetical protein n=1 Tax=Streptomyces sp. NPDC006332 TaxID=3155456 RepID=UPI0033A840AD
MLERPSTTRRYTRGVAAAVIAVAALVLAANAGPARAAEPTQVQGQHAVPDTAPSARSTSQRA